MDLKKTMIRFGICFLVGFLLALAVWGVLGPNGDFHGAAALAWIARIIIFLLIFALFYWIVLGIMMSKAKGAAAIVPTVIISALIALFVTFLCTWTARWTSGTFFGLLPLTVVNALILFLVLSKLNIPHK
jgi:cytochrome bd-type quinol oxidase subunit 2